MARRRSVPRNTTFFIFVHRQPWYLSRSYPDLFLGESELTGATNLMAYYGLEHSYSKFSGKKLKEQLSSFLPNLPGNIDTPGHQDNRSILKLYHLHVSYVYIYSLSKFLVFTNVN